MRSRKELRLLPDTSSNNEDFNIPQISKGGREGVRGGVLSDGMHIAGVMFG